MGPQNAELWPQSHPSQLSAGLALSLDSRLAVGELGLITEEACLSFLAAVTWRLCATGQMQVVATALSMQLSFLSSSPATLLSTDPTAATKWLGLVPSPDFPSSSASISQSVKWLQWPHARGCEDLLAKGTHIAPSLGEAPLAPYLSLSYQPMWDPAPGGAEVCGEECLLLFNLWVSSGCRVARGLLTA